MDLGAACPVGRPCVICQEDRINGILCEGPHEHFTCDRCLAIYTIGAAEAVDGDLARQIEVPHGPVSPPGALPCPLYKHGCPYGAFPQAALLALLGTRGLERGHEAIDVYVEVQKRVAETRQSEATRARETAEAAHIQKMDVVAKAGNVVKVALLRGHSVPCPICQEAWRKDDACMHMDCSKCGHKFCYVCGRLNLPDQCPRGSGCDDPSPFLERQPGWTDMSGHEALVKYQVWLMSFYVNVAQKVLRPWWSELMTTEPLLLTNVLEGRNIDLNITEPPILGRRYQRGTPAWHAEVSRRTAEALRFLEPAMIELRQAASVVSGTAVEVAPLAIAATTSHMEDQRRWQIQSFVELTGCEDLAAFFLDANNWDMSRAIEAHGTAVQREEESRRTAAIGAETGHGGPAPRAEAIERLEPPLDILVQGAGGYGRAVNGRYRAQGQHNGRPLYRQIGGSSVMYYFPHMWRLNDEDSLSGWYYSREDTALLPPQGQWTTVGYQGRDVNPPPFIRHMGAPQALDVTAFHERFPHGVVVVEGAGGVAAPVNGIFRFHGLHQHHSRFHQEGGQAIIYWDTAWRINYRHDTGGWYYCVDDPEGALELPPTGTWTTEGYTAGNADPPPLVRCVGFQDRTEAPHIIRVSIARANGQRRNEIYIPCGSHAGRTKYRLRGDIKIIYYRVEDVGGVWCMNAEDTTTAWLYEAPGESEWPPEGLWRPRGDHDDRNVDLLPLVEHQATLAPPPIESWRSCRQGQDVRVLPVELAEGPTRASAANWTRDSADHAGQIGRILRVDTDNTLLLRFDDDRELWYAVGSCTALLEPPELIERPTLEAWVEGAGQRGACLNGRFIEDGQHGGRPKYRKVDSGAVLYWHRSWKLSLGSLRGWLYSVLDTSLLPPEGPWTTQGYGGRDVLPAPSVLLCEAFIVTVSEADGAWALANGRYKQTNIQNDHPKYSHVDGNAVIEWSEGYWQLHMQRSLEETERHRRLERCCYGCLAPDRYPPLGPWTWLGQWADLDAHVTTPPTVAREAAPALTPHYLGQHGPPILSIADCAKGKEVQILPIQLAEPATQASQATWTEACAAKCGHKGTILEVDTDHTLQIRFPDRSLWFAIGSCTLLDTWRIPGWRVMVRDAGGRRGARLNGTYDQDGTHNGYPLFRQRCGGRGVLYKGPDAWRISPGTLGGWFYGIVSNRPLPPEGPWTTHGYNGREVQPAPTVRLVWDEEAARHADTQSIPAVPDSSDGESDGGDGTGDEETMGAPPTMIGVMGAGGVGEEVNGTYHLCGTYRQRPKYRHETNMAVIYFRGSWQINYRDDVRGWYYSHVSQEAFPPQGRWTTIGYDDGDADPAPLVMYGRSRLPISTGGVCQVNERVRVLPAAIAMEAAVGSPASWTEECAAHCGDIGQIVAVDTDGTIRVAFEDGDLFWFAVGCCTKDLREG